MLFPDCLALGDRIDVIAPSGPFDGKQLQRGLERLVPHFDVRPSPWLFRSPRGFLAGSDRERALELQWALDNEVSRAILIARGGYGLARIQPALCFERFLARPKWLVGFSDATVLHAHLNHLGVASLHAPNATTLARATADDVAVLVGTLLGTAQEDVTGLRPLVPGTAAGPLFGGNLTVLFAQAAAGALAVPEGAILLLEDVSETSYRIDRMLTALLAGGHLRRCAGVVLGEFTDCTPGKFGVSTDEVLAERLGGLTVPVACGLPLGHGTRQLPLVLGQQVQLHVAHDSVLRFGHRDEHSTVP